MMATALCKDNVFKMQSDRFKIFKFQDVEKGNFDVKFMVDDKIIYAHRIFLTPVSETLDAWLSDRWSNKDEAIKIETYSYENFYQFLCFIYIGQCELTNWSIFQIVDMAEFFGVGCLKDYCDYFLTKMKLDAENIERYYELCQTYLLPLLTQTIENFIFENGNTIIRSKNFVTYKMPFFKLFISLLKWYSRETIFQAAYEWVDHQVMEKSKDMNNENFNVQEAIKTELYTIIPDPQFYKMNQAFLLNFVVENGFILSPKELQKFFLRCRDRRLSNDQSFQWVYQLAEKQAQQKQRMSSNDENFNIGESIKADLSEVFPHIKLHELDKKILMDFFLENGFLLSPTELQKFFLCCRNRRLSNEQAFQWVYELVEKQALKKQAMSSNSTNFNLVDSIKADLAEVLPHVKFYEMDKQFLMNFVFEKGYLLSPHGMLLAYNNYIYSGPFKYGETKRFEYIYEIAKNQALQKQKMSSNNNDFYVSDSIKTDLAKVIPNVKFHWMEKHFLMDFVVENGFFLSSAEFYRIFQWNKHQDEKQRFKDVYEIAEKQALKKQIIAAQNNENFIVADSIKADLAEVMPHVTITNKIYEFLFERGIISFPMFLFYCAFLLNKSR